jgi:transcriptional regulator with XRE-family HTH domain
MRNAGKSAIGQRLKDARRRSHLTQRELAEQAGVGLNSIRKVEQTDYEPTLRLYRRLAESLGVRIEWLLFGIEPMTVDMESVE